MSWSSRFGSWGGKFSPFGRPSPTAPSNSTQVTESDFSYITSEDIKRTQEEAKANRPHRETDVLVLKRNRTNHPIHFPAYSIDDGQLTIGKIKEAAATRIDLPASAASRIKLFYKGRNLKDDDRPARDEGLRSDAQAELLMVVGDQITEPSDSEGEEEEDDSIPGKPDKRKKKKKRSKKKGGRSSNSGTATPDPSLNAHRSFDPDVTYAPGNVPPPKSAPPPPKPIQTPIEKLDVLASHFHTNFVPSCVQFISNPPEDPAKREFDHKRLTETVLAQVLLKLDAVETEGNDEARQRRKALVKEVQGMLNQLDNIMKT